MPRLKGSADLLEDRRKRALALLDSGYSLNEVGAIEHWKQKHWPRIKKRCAVGVARRPASHRCEPIGIRHWRIALTPGITRLFCPKIISDDDDHYR
jgi:hypothetical protein